MSPSSFTESVVEDVALAWLGGLGYSVPQDGSIAAAQALTAALDVVT